MKEARVGSAGIILSIIFGEELCWYHGHISENNRQVLEIQVSRVSRVSSINICRPDESCEYMGCGLCYALEE